MSLQKLYQETIKRHNANPVGQCVDFEFTHKAAGYNPSCGDELDLYVALEESKRIKQIGFQADACAICKASISLLCQHSHNKTATQLLNTAAQLEEALNANLPIDTSELTALSAVSAHKSRINCALLPWQTLTKIIESQDKHRA